MFYCAVIYCTVSTAQCPEWVNDIHKGNSNPNSAGRQNETLLLLQPLLSTFSSLKNFSFFFFSLSSHVQQHKICLSGCSALKMKLANVFQCLYQSIKHLICNAVQTVQTIVCIQVGQHCFMCKYESYELN